MNQCIFSIDIGTTAIKLCLLTIQVPYHIIHCNTIQHHAYTHTANNQYELDPYRIIDIILYQYINHTIYTVKHIVLTGQMHGIVLWNDIGIQELHNSNIDRHTANSDQQYSNVTNVITWLDQRCNNNTIDQSNLSQSDTIISGYGMYTLTYLIQHQLIDITRYLYCGTIADLIYMVLTYDTHNNDSTVSYQHPSMASSFGMYNNATNEWKSELMNEYDHNQYISASRLHILPQISYTHTLPVNLYCRQHIECSDSCNVHISIGDATAQYTGLCMNNTEINTSTNNCIINIGTSMQLTVAVNHDIDINNLPCTIECRPGINQSSSLLVCASLNGGNVYHHLAKQYAQYNKCTLDESYHILNVNGMNCMYECNVPIKPTLYGERYDNTLHCEYDNIMIEPDDIIPFDNMPHRYSIGNISASLCRALIYNLYDMCCMNNTLMYNIIQSSKCIVLCGSATTYHNMYQTFIEQIFQKPVEYIDSRQSQYAACIGAAHIVQQT